MSSLPAFAVEHKISPTAMLRKSKRGVQRFCMLDSTRSKEEAWLGSKMAIATYSTAALPALMGFRRPGMGIFGLASKWHV